MISLQWDPPLAFAGTKIWNWDGLRGSQEIGSIMLVRWVFNDTPLQEWSEMKPSQQEQVDGIWINLMSTVPWCLSMSIYPPDSPNRRGSSWQAKEKLANQSSEEESKSTADKDVEEDEWSSEHVLESSRFRLRLTLFCNMFCCNFLYTFVQSVAICCSSSTVTGWFSCCCKNGGPQEDRRMLHMPHLKYSPGVPTCPGGPNSYNRTQHNAGRDGLGWKYRGWSFGQDVMSNCHPKRILFIIEFVVWSSQSLDTCIFWVESRLRIHPHRCYSFSGASVVRSKNEAVGKPNMFCIRLGDDASPVDINDFPAVRSTFGICWDEDMELRWAKRVSRDWKHHASTTSQVVGCSMTPPCRNDQKWNHLNKSKLMEFELIWCLLYHDVYLCLSIHLTLQIEGGPADRPKRS